MFKRFRSNEEGASMTEYALLLVFIAIVSLGVLTILGGQVSSVFQTVITEAGW